MAGGPSTTLKPTTIAAAGACIFVMLMIMGGGGGGGGQAMPAARCPALSEEQWETAIAEIFDDRAHNRLDGNYRFGEADNVFFNRSGCYDGLRGLLAYRKAQLSRSCRRALFQAGRAAADAVVEVCLDANRLRGGCTVVTLGGARSGYRFDDLMHARGCEVHAFDPAAAEEAVRHTSPLAKVYPIGVGAEDAVVKTATDAAPKSVKQLANLLRMAGLENRRVDVLRLNDAGDMHAWSVIDEWTGSNAWEYFDQLSLAVHVDLASGLGLHLGAWAKAVAALMEIPFTPINVAMNAASPPLYRAPPVMHTIRKSAEITYIKGPYRPRTHVTPAFWKQWGFEPDVHGDTGPVPKGPGLPFIKHALSLTAPSACEVGLQVSEDDAPARVCTSSGLRGRGACVMYVLSDAAAAVQDTLAELLEEDRGCDVWEYRVGGNEGGTAHVIVDGKARKLPERVHAADVARMNWLADAMAQHGHATIDVLRVDVGPSLAPAVLAALPLATVPQLSLRLHVREDLANAADTATALAGVLAAYPKPYYSSVGGLGDHADGRACAYEVAFVRE